MPTILYIDDERQNLIAFKASFRRTYEVLTAQSGEEAIALLDTHPEVEVIISDQRMPSMTGVEFFERILPRHPEPVRMVLTGYSDVQAIIEAINKGQVYYYITKPWNHKELKLIIDKGLEAYALRQENRHLTAEKQRLELRAAQQERQNILSRFETLKNQVNPHFLFNCLNALSSLIHEDTDLADRFIAKLTRVYRYVLELKDEERVTLDEELHFIRSYLFLQQIRFGNRLQWYLQVQEGELNRYIPPLTLQLLVENAIKHNIVSQAQPLTIELYSDGPDWFVVKNTYQPRDGKSDSTRIGLRNLEARYGFLCDRKPAFFIDNDHYIARVPLLDGPAGPMFDQP
ncbi:MAG: response regulator [Bacteroidetes bacterium]|nr:MAG: response regulator [Bacteroidota bacterium]